MNRMVLASGFSCFNSYLSLFAVAWIVSKSLSIQQPTNKAQYDHRDHTNKQFHIR
jgi:hypothetical protein